MVVFDSFTRNGDGFCRDTVGRWFEPVEMGWSDADGREVKVSEGEEGEGRKVAGCRFVVTITVNKGELCLRMDSEACRGSHCSHLWVYGIRHVQYVWDVAWCTYSCTPLLSDGKMTYSTTLCTRIFLSTCQGCTSYMFDV